MENTEKVLREITKIVLENRNTMEIIFEKQAEILSLLNKTVKEIELIKMNERLDELGIANEEILSVIFDH